MQHLRPKPQTPMWVVVKTMGRCLGTLNIRCRIILRTQKGTIILTTTHVEDPESGKRLKKLNGHTAIVNSMQASGSVLTSSACRS